MCILWKKEEIQHSSMELLIPTVKLFHSCLSLYITPPTNKNFGTSKLGVKNIYSVKSPLIFYVSILTQPDFQSISLSTGLEFTCVGKAEDRPTINQQKDSRATVPMRKPIPLNFSLINILH